MRLSTLKTMAYGTRNGMVRVTREVNAICAKSPGARTYWTNIMKLTPIQMSKLFAYQDYNPDGTLSDIRYRLFRRRIRDIQPDLPLARDPRVDKRADNRPVTTTALRIEESPEALRSDGSGGLGWAHVVLRGRSRAHGARLEGSQPGVNAENQMGRHQRAAPSSSRPVPIVEVRPPKSPVVRGSSTGLDVTYHPNIVPGDLLRTKRDIWWKTCMHTMYRMIVPQVSGGVRPAGGSPTCQTPGTSSRECIPFASVPSVLSTNSGACPPSPVAPSIWRETSKIASFAGRVPDRLL